MLAFQEVSAEGSTREQDRLLVERLIARDRGAWRHFQRSITPRITRAIRAVAARFSSMLQSADVDEIQAIFMLELNRREMHKLRSFDPALNLPLAGWLELLARRTAYDYVRRVARSPARLGVSVGDDVLACEAPDALRHVCAKDECRRVLGSVANLPERDQRFFELSFVEGWSNDCVASELRIEVESVYKRRHRMRAKLAIGSGP